MRKLVFTTFILLTACSCQSHPEKYTTQFISVESVVHDIIHSTEHKKLRELKNTPKNELIKFHHGFGTHIRNQYGLWQGNDLLIKDACHQTYCHPDDASLKIIHALWVKLQTHQID